MQQMRCSYFLPAVTPSISEVQREHPAVVVDNVLRQTGPVSRW